MSGFLGELESLRIFKEKAVEEKEEMLRRQGMGGFAEYEKLMYCSRD